MSPSRPIVSFSAQIQSPSLLGLDHAQTGDYKNGSGLSVRNVHYAFAFPRFFRIESPRISIRWAL